MMLAASFLSRAHCGGMGVHTKHVRQHGYRTFIACSLGGGLTPCAEARLARAASRAVRSAGPSGAGSYPGRSTACHRRLDIARIPRSRTPTIPTEPASILPVARLRSRAED